MKSPLLNKILIFAGVIGVLVSNLPVANAGAVSDRIAFKANARMRASGKDAVAMRFMDALFKKNPSIPAGEAIRLTIDFSNGLEQQASSSGTNWKGRYGKHFDLGVKAILLNDKLKNALGKWVAVGEILGELTTMAADAKLDSDLSQYGGSAGLKKWSDAISEEAARKHFDETLDNAFTQGRKKSSEYSKAFQALFSSQLQANPSDSAQAILESNPLLAGMFENSADLKKLLQTADQQLTNGEETDKKVNELLAVVKTNFEELGKTRQEQMQDASDNLRRQHRRMLVETSLDALSFIFSFGSPEDQQKGKAIQAIGSAALQLDSVLRTFDEVSKISGSGIGSAILAGNLLSVGAGLFQALSGAPTADQLILESLAEVRKQLNEIQTEMHDRFNRVDARLSDMQLTMEAGFNALGEFMRDSNARTLERLETAIIGVEDLKVQVHLISDNLARLENSFISSISDLASRDLRLLTASCRKNLTLSEFQRCRKSLEIYANEFSVQPASTLVNGATDFSTDESVLNFLKAHPDSLSRLNFLAGVTRDRFGAPQTHKPTDLPNPLAWLTASRALLDSLSRNTSLTSSRQLGKPLMETLRKVQQQGHKISQSVRDLARRDQDGSFAFARGAMITLLDARNLLVGTAKNMDSATSRLANGMNLKGLTSIGDNDGEMEQRLSAPDANLLDAAKVKASLAGDSRRQVSAEEAGFLPLADWAPRSAIAGTALAAARLDLDVTGSWKGEPTSVLTGGARDCTYTCSSNGCYVTLVDCTFTKRFTDKLVVTRTAKVMTGAEANKRVVRAESVEPIVSRECDVRCRTHPVQNYCMFELSTGACRETDASVAALKTPIGKPTEEKTANEAALTALRTALAAKAEEVLQGIRVGAVSEKDALTGFKKLGLARLILDSWLRATYEAAYLENDELLALISGNDAPHLTLDKAISWGVEAMHNPQHDPFQADWDKLKTAIHRFQIAQDARQVIPGLIPVDAVLEEVGVLMQALKMPYERADSRTVIGHFMEKAARLK